MAADIVVTAAAVEVLDVSKAEIYEGVIASAAVATVLVGTVVAFDSNGQVVLADADGAGTLKEAKGIVTAKNGKTVSILKRGRVAGFTLTNNVYGARVFISATAGALNDTITGTVAAVGQVVPISDSSATKCLYVEFSWSVPYA